MEVRALIRALIVKENPRVLRIRAYGFFIWFRAIPPLQMFYSKIYAVKLAVGGVWL